MPHEISNGFAGLDMCLFPSMLDDFYEAISAYFRKIPANTKRPSCLRCRWLSSLCNARAPLSLTRYCWYVFIGTVLAVGSAAALEHALEVGNEVRRVGAGVAFGVFAD